MTPSDKTEREHCERVTGPQMRGLQTTNASDSEVIHILLALIVGALVAVLLCLFWMRLA